MSKYTTELRYILETLSPENPINGGSALLFGPFADAYSFGTAEEKATLHSDICRHFYTREIGLETVGLFKLRLEDKMREIMPYYNKMWNVVNKDYEFLDTDVVSRTREETEVTNEERNGEQTDNTDGTSVGMSTYEISNSSTDNNTSESNKRHLDTPQASFQNLEAYATDIDKTNNTDTTTRNGSNEGTANNNTQNETNAKTNYSNATDRSKNVNENYTVKGRSGHSVGMLMEEYLNAQRMIKRQIFEELEPLFMGVW